MSRYSVYDARGWRIKAHKRKSGLVVTYIYRVSFETSDSVVNAPEQTVMAYYEDLAWGKWIGPEKLACWPRYGSYEENEYAQGLFARLLKVHDLDSLIHAEHVLNEVKRKVRRYLGRLENTA